jgi:hypothetical protein
MSSQTPVMSSQALIEVEYKDQINTQFVSINWGLASLTKGKSLGVKLNVVPALAHDFFYKFSHNGTTHTQACIENSIVRSSLSNAVAFKKAIAQTNF